MGSDQSVAPLTDDLFGDRIGHYTGSLEFAQSDFSVPGNNALPVGVGRRLATGAANYRAGMFSDWDLDIPHLHGIFATGSTNNHGWAIDAGAPDRYRRCSYFGLPPEGRPVKGTTIWQPEEYWFGHSLYVPGQGDQDLVTRGPANTSQPGDGNSYPIVTAAGWQITCLPSLANAQATGNIQGEGFAAVAPDGTRYRFDWMVTRFYPSLIKGTTSNVLPRSQVLILPTLVTDRHGNTVNYTYDVADPWKLVSITASDGRSVAFSYVSGTRRVQTASDGVRTWSYEYNGSQNSLSRVVRPDGSAWQFNLAPLLYGIAYSTQPNCESTGTVVTDTQTGSLVHPSGATGSFTAQTLVHGVAGVPQHCVADGSTVYAYTPRYFAARSLIGKSITGPGLGSLNWSYGYSAPAASWAPCNGCAATKTVQITDPRGHVTRHTYGNRYFATEGQLQSVEEGWDGSSALRTTTYRYRSPSAGPYPEVVGYNPHMRSHHFSGTRTAPQDRRVITQQGTSFIWEATAFDSRARPTTVTKSSSLGSRTETTAYFDHAGQWVLGQMASVTEASTGAVMTSNSYDASTANLLSTSHYARLQHSFSYYGDGTVYRRFDAAGRATTFSNYNRGIAQNVSYPDNATESAVVNPIGWITSVTDANGFTTRYGHDANGRINLITPPTGDSVAWNPTSLVFEPVGADEYGLNAGHWRQTVSTGNARKVTYFDALWRPVLTKTFDAANPATTGADVLRRFDADGRTTFESYPTRGVTSVNAGPPGTTTTYDALGRVAQSVQSSELGNLTTRHDYLAGFVHRVTNPRGHVTSTSFQAFDQPGQDSPTAIVAPEGVNVLISRDVFGKSMAITRSGNHGGGSLSATRTTSTTPMRACARPSNPRQAPRCRITTAPTTWLGAPAARP